MRVAQTLLLSIVSSVNASDLKLAAINVQASSELVTLAKQFKNFTAVQNFYPLYKQLESLNINTTPVIIDDFEQCIYVGSKNKSYNHFIFHKALTTLKPGGIFLIAFENEIGASRYEKDFSKLYSGPIFSEQKSKCRVFGTVNFDPSCVQIQALDEIKNIGPKLFLFNQAQIDSGSKLLANTLNGNLSGCIYEPCSGAGALSVELLENNPNITQLIGVEADWLAVEYAKQRCIDPRASFEWADATKNLGKKFQTIILNPPFHSGANVNQSLGLKCIQAAYECLDLHGTLYVVQNEFLPYRKNLSFGDKTNVLVRENGFIVWQHTA
jgi:16S rRNA (guanine1207-N2)-methyltransferase